MFRVSLFTSKIVHLLEHENKFLRHCYAEVSTKIKSVIATITCDLLNESHTIRCYLLLSIENVNVNLFEILEYEIKRKTDAMTDVKDEIY